jgi:hypothetical protein
MSYDPNDPPEPTAWEESLFEKDCEISALKEQIVEAHRLLVLSITDATLDGYQQWRNDRQAWVDQNEHIVKEANKCQ